MANKPNAAFDELAGMDTPALLKELDDTYRQLFTLRLQVATRQLSNVKELKKTRRKIARIKTLQRQREVSAAGGGQ
jgi:large subunit ribosomal protein L29